MEGVKEENSKSNVQLEFTSKFLFKAGAVLNLKNWPSPLSYFRTWGVKPGRFRPRQGERILFLKV